MKQVTGITIDQMTYTGISIQEGSNVSMKEKLKNPAITSIPPRGYVTLEQFAEDTINRINDYCNRHDIH